MACPYFEPREIVTEGWWQHPGRLPLGAGWRGSCCATADKPVPSDDTLRDLCNLGYARACERLAHDRDWDAIRFSVASESSQQVSFCYVCELGHAPKESGKLTYDLSMQVWLNAGADPRVQRLADAYLAVYKSRRRMPGEEATA